MVLTTQVEGAVIIAVPNRSLARLCWLRKANPPHPHPPCRVLKKPPRRTLLNPQSSVDKLPRIRTRLGVLFFGNWHVWETLVNHLDHPLSLAFVQVRKDAATAVLSVSASVLASRTIIRPCPCGPARASLISPLRFALCCGVIHSATPALHS